MARGPGTLGLTHRRLDGAGEPDDAASAQPRRCERCCAGLMLGVAVVGTRCDADWTPWLRNCGSLSPPRKVPSAVGLFGCRHAGRSRERPRPRQRRRRFWGVSACRDSRRGARDRRRGGGELATVVGGGGCRGFMNGWARANEAVGVGPDDNLAVFGWSIRGRLEASSGGLAKPAWFADGGRALKGWA